VEYVPDMKIIELKSLKEYIGRLRTVVVSYERLINILYDHLDRVYEPARMEVTMMCTPRGGISSRLTRRSP
jgi:7-cyano-7-deazaguanine reductase